MSSATFQSAAWDCEPFRWRSVLVIAATNPVAGLESYQSRRGAGIWRCVRHQVALREPWHRGDWLSAAKHTCPEASARHRSPDGTSHWTRGGATSTGQRLLRRTIKRDAVTNARRRNLSAIQDSVRSDNLTNLAINAAPYNGWRFYRSAGHHGEQYRGASCQISGSRTIEASGGLAQRATTAAGA